MIFSTSNGEEGPKKSTRILKLFLIRNEILWQVWWFMQVWRYINYVVNLLSLQKKINTVFSALIINTFIAQMNHPKKSISLLIFTPLYESLQLSIESKITEVCLLFNHNAANFCRLQKSKCMVNQIIHHFYNGCTYYSSYGLGSLFFFLALDELNTPK